jgi:hypothetical protein
MSKNTDTIRKLAEGVKADSTTENIGYILGYCADEIDRLREALDRVRVDIARAIPFLNQACKKAYDATDPENFEI